MKRFDLLITAYSFLLLIGGVIGFIVAGSFMSLVMSGSFATMLVGSLYWLQKNQAAGQRAIFLLLSTLILFFGYRWFNGKFMPGGMLFLLTCLVLFTASRWAEKSKK